MPPGRRDARSGSAIQREPAPAGGPMASGGDTALGSAGPDRPGRRCRRAPEVVRQSPAQSEALSPPQSGGAAVPRRGRGAASRPWWWAARPWARRPARAHGGGECGRCPRPCPGRASRGARPAPLAPAPRPGPRSFPAGVRGRRCDAGGRGCGRGRRAGRQAGREGGSAVGRARSGFGTKAEGRPGRPGGGDCWGQERDSGAAVPARLRAAAGRTLPAVKRWAAAPGTRPLRSPQRVGPLLSLRAREGWMWRITEVEKGFGTALP